jgi:uncharacterized protein
MGRQRWPPRWRHLGNGPIFHPGEGTAIWPVLFLLVHRRRYSLRLMARPPTLCDLRRYAIARTLFQPTTLKRAINKLGFVQADPIRAPARAQDLALRHRVHDYRAGDLERLYPKLGIEEDFFVNYGFMSRATQALMHPRTPRRSWSKPEQLKADEVLSFVRERGLVHPREVDTALQHGKVTNWFGGASNATTQILDGLHYRGLLRVARRENGIRLYAPRAPTPAPQSVDVAIDALVDIIVEKYAPLPERSLGGLIMLLRGGVPQWAHFRRDAFQRAKRRCSSTMIDGVRWLWPAGENSRAAHWEIDDRLRFLAPLDPLVWDRQRFHLFWGWEYRFEAYVPAAKRMRGYYALPVLWRDQIIGWANVSAKGGSLEADVGYIGRAPSSKQFKAALDDEVERVRVFLARER